MVGGEFSVMNGQSRQRHCPAQCQRLSWTPISIWARRGWPGVYPDGANQSDLSRQPIPARSVQTNFTIYAGGAFTAFNGTHRLGFARLNSDGTVDTTFLDTAYNQFAGLPRERYGDPLGTVLASGLQSDGNVMIGGSFERVGGGQSDDLDVRPESIGSTRTMSRSRRVTIIRTQKTRSGIRNRSNVARLIGGATPGPGNIGLLYPELFDQQEPDAAVCEPDPDQWIPGAGLGEFRGVPGLAQNGVDYSYGGLEPALLDGLGIRQSDGPDAQRRLFRARTALCRMPMAGSCPAISSSPCRSSILDNTNSLNNLNAQFQLSDPLGADQFYLGGAGYPAGGGAGSSLAPLTLIDDHHQSGTFGFASATYTGVGQTGHCGGPHQRQLRPGVVELRHHDQWQHGGAGQRLQRGQRHAHLPVGDHKSGVQCSGAGQQLQQFGGETGQSHVVRPESAGERPGLLEPDQCGVAHHQSELSRAT